MTKSIPAFSMSERNKKLRQLVEKDRSILDEIADARVCNDVAIELHSLRKNSGLTQKELAKKIGVKQSNISRWEQPGYQGYKVKLLSKMTRALGGRLVISLAPLTNTYTAVVAYRELDSHRTTVTSPDGRVTSYEKTRELQMAMTISGSVEASYATT